MNGSLNEPAFVDTQYQDTTRLNARLRLHQECSTNSYGWHRWLFDRLSFPPCARILELGCGTGAVWAENQDRLGQDLNLILSDRFLAMVKQARLKMKESVLSMQYAGIDAGAVPLETGSMDAVVANHMLYHAVNLPGVLAEITRVLKPGGVLYAATNGMDHLKEIDDLLARLDPALARYGNRMDSSFSLENGECVLQHYFREIKMTCYPDSLLVNDEHLLADYILSLGNKLSAEKEHEVRVKLREIMANNGGILAVRKNSGVFEARRPMPGVRPGAGDNG
ncbi:MAG: methyltransferase domain-containing protein [Anaerolineales bacterium]|nr:methyltransferase domain-containing protein [Anaerolineales bacterium]